VTNKFCNGCRVGRAEQGGFIVFAGQAEYRIEFSYGRGYKKRARIRREVVGGVGRVKAAVNTPPLIFISKLGYII